MKVRINTPTDEDLYIRTWQMAQADSPWSKYTGPFAPNLEDELDAVRVALRDPDSRCLMVIDEGKAVGVLACRKADELTRLGSGDREPAVLPDHRQSSAGMELLDAAYEWSIGEGLAGVFALLKLPPEVDPRDQWHVNLYFKCGMVLTRSVIEYGASIHRIESYANPQVEFEAANDVGLDRLIELVMRSFDSTRAFEYDPLVHDPAEVRAFLSEVRNDEGFFVASLGDEAVGFVFARTPTGSEYGHIAAIGTMPEHRGKKVGTCLLQKAHNYLVGKGYEHSFVGTSESNLTSRALYRKMGYQGVYRILKFIKATKGINIARDLMPHELNDLHPLWEL